MAEFPDRQLQFPDRQTVVFPSPEQQHTLLLQVAGQHIEPGHHLPGSLPWLSLFQGPGILQEKGPFALEYALHFLIDPLPGLLMDPFPPDLFPVPPQPVDPLEGLGRQFQFFLFLAQFSHILVPYHLSPGNGHGPPLPVSVRRDGQLLALVHRPSLPVQDGQPQAGMEKAVPILAVPRQQPGPEQGFHPEETEKCRPQDQFTPEDPGNPQDIAGNVSSVQQDDRKGLPQPLQTDFFPESPPAQPPIGQKQLGQITEQDQVIHKAIGIDILVGIGTGLNLEHQLMPVIGQGQPG